MHAENFFAATDVRAVDDDAAVKAAGAEESGVKDIGTVGRGDEDDPIVRFEAVHLDEELVQGLLALIVSRRRDRRRGDDRQHRFRR